MFRMEERLEWGKLATFVENKSIPIYNWFYYKEGFSRGLVMKFLDRFQPKILLDPFCGSGTSLLACKEKGIDCIGYDTSKLAVLVSETKLIDWDVEELKATLRKIKNIKFKRPPTGHVKKDIRKFFSRYALEDALFLREIINDIDLPVRKFFLLVLINTITKCSYIYKDGSMLRVVKRPLPPFRKYFFRRAEAMIKDVVKMKKRFKRCNASVTEGDARNLSIEDSSVDLIMTSPPYLNKIEYTKIYRVEEYFVFGESSRKGVRSYIGLDTSKRYNIFPELNLPVIADAYFYDMQLCVREMYRVLNHNGIAVIVIGNACFPDRVIDSDILLAKIAKDAGFDIDVIYVVAKRFCTSNRTKKIGIMRESVLIMKKQ
ncbi:MAG: hypothetical protein DRP03_03760 [Candidatus Aenigmatarchaeota archaeon]|nr:MAG: hypothetical protein DRP03_03760 [Candidatus Aenigmarchaeota archaeon]